MRTSGHGAIVNAVVIDPRSVRLEPKESTMTNEHHPSAHSDEPSDDVDAMFAELAASMPELAALDEPDFGVADVVISIPDPTGRCPAAQMTIGVPADLAPVIRREFAPDRIAAMMDAVSAMMAQRLPLDE